MSYFTAVGRTARNWTVNWRRSTVLFFVLFFTQTSIGTIVLALFPAPAFLIDRQPGLHVGLALLAWSLVSILSSVISGILVDLIGYKRVIAFGIILGLFSSLAMSGSVALHPHPASSSFFWIAAVVASVVLSGVYVACASGVVAYTANPISFKLTAALVVLVSNAGLALAGILHAPFIKTNIASAIATGAPAVAHVSTVVALLSACLALALALFGLPFIKKNRDVRAFDDAAPGVALSSLKRVSFWRLVFFSLTWIGARACLGHALYLLPLFAKRSLGVDVDPGVIVAGVWGLSGVLAVPAQLLLTSANPFLVMPLGGLVSSAGVGLMVVPLEAVGTRIVLVSVGCGLVALGEAVWWPAFLAYAANAAQMKRYLGAYLSVAIATFWYGIGLSGVIAPILLDTYCPANCNAAVLWSIPAACSFGLVLLGVASSRWSHDHHVRLTWRKTLKVHDFDLELDDLSGSELGLVSSYAARDGGEEPSPRMSDSEDVGNPF